MVAGRRGVAGRVGVGKQWTGATSWEASKKARRSSVSWSIDLEELKGKRLEWVDAQNRNCAKRLAA